MSILSTVLLILFVPVCVLLILIVLLQAGKGGGLAGAFGGGGGQTFLGARGAADFLSKLTIYLAIAFMTLALILSLTYGTGGRSRGLDLGQDQKAAQTDTPGDNAVPGTGEAAEDISQPEAPAPDTEGETPSSEGGN